MNNLAVPTVPQNRIPETYIQPEETSCRNRAFQIVALVGIVLGTGLLLAPFFTSLSLAISLVGAGVTALSAFSFHYLSTIDSSERLFENVKAGNHCWAKFLLFLGANPNVRSGDSSLRFAAYIGDASMVQSLLDAGADPNVRGWDMGTPLYEAIRNKYDQAVEILLKNGADPSIKRDLDPAALELATQIFDHYRHNPLSDSHVESDTRTRAERMIAIDRIITMLEAHNQPADQIDALVHHADRIDALAQFYERNR